MVVVATSNLQSGRFRLRNSTTRPLDEVALARTGAALAGPIKRVLQRRKTSETTSLPPMSDSCASSPRGGASPRSPTSPRSSAASPRASAASPCASCPSPTTPMASSGRFGASKESSMVKLPSVHPSPRAGTLDEAAMASALRTCGTAFPHGPPKEVAMSPSCDIRESSPIGRTERAGALRWDTSGGFDENAPGGLGGSPALAREELGDSGRSSGSRLLSRRMISLPNPLIIEPTPPTSQPVPAWVSDHSSGSSRASRSGAERKAQWLQAGEKIFDRFCWDTVLQEQGCGGKVVVCRKKIDGMSPKQGSPSSPDMVLKMRPKEMMSQEVDEYRMLLEHMMNMPPHCNVLPPDEVLEDQRFFYVIMPKAAGGTLLEGLVNRFDDGVIPDNTMKSLVRDMLLALSHLHCCGVLHRDVKPDNFVWHQCDRFGPDVDQRIVLIDFDLSDADSLHTKKQPAEPHWVGTARFSAPESFLGVFSPQSDLYSVGVILYLLMTGRMPFDDTIFVNLVEDKMPPGDETRCLRKIADTMYHAGIDWACSPWPEQPLCESFCKGLLCFNPQERPASADVALSHLWLADVG